MNKPWLGYFGSAMIFLAGVLMLIDTSYLSGILLILVAIAGFILKLRMNAKHKQ